MTENTPTPEPAGESPPAQEKSAENNSPGAANENDPEVATKDAATSNKNKSFVARMKHAHMSASTPLEFMKSFFLILFHTIGFLIIIALLLGIPIAMMVVGIIHNRQCPAQRFVPIWLYVSGALFGFMQLVFLIRSVAKRSRNRNEGEPKPSKSYSWFNLLVSLFTFAWFIAGNVWVFRIYEPNTTDPFLPNYCHAAPYYFSFVIIIVAYVWMLLICCCSSCVACAGVHAASKSSPSGKEVDDDDASKKDEPK